MHIYGIPQRITTKPYSDTLFLILQFIHDNKNAKIGFYKCLDSREVGVRNGGVKQPTNAAEDKRGQEAEMCAPDV